MAPRGVSLKDPADVMKVCQRIISKIMKNGKEVEHSGRICNLLQVFLKAWELRPGNKDPEHQVVTIEVVPPADVSRFLKGDKIVEEVA